jgi:chorismate dehydratase
LAHKITVGAVSYLNTKPLIYGFEQGMMKSEIDLVIDYPANIAHQLLHNKIDIGLLPVAVLPQLKEYHIISDYCIGCDGPVASVCLFSDVPLHEIETVLLDYQSKTSVALLKILLRQRWKINPKLIAAEKNFEQHISGITAGLVIGDRAFVQRRASKYSFDLGQAWKEMTGLPFVFAAWVSNRKMDSAFVDSFNTATGAGLTQLKNIVSVSGYEYFDLLRYYSENISYTFDDNKKIALKHFLQYLG